MTTCCQSCCLHSAGGKLAYHRIRAGINLFYASNERRETSEEDEPEVERIMSRGASRGRSPEAEEEKGVESRDDEDG